MSDNDQPPRAVRIDSWGFETDKPGGRSKVPLFGAFLIVFGLLLAAGQLFKVAQLGASALFLALGVILLFVWLRDHSDAALYVGVFVTALALADLLTGAAVLKGNGWGTLFLGIGVVAIAPIRARAGRNWGWPLVIGGLLCLWGGSEVATSYMNIDADRLVGPALLVLLGIWIVSRSRRSRG
ncbi:MAG: hypothetical protein ABSD62_09390 [Candidatus Limnocylindrales bacterium]|jgi:hypothetical protein